MQVPRVTALFTVGCDCRTHTRDCGTQRALLREGEKMFVHTAKNDSGGAPVKARALLPLQMGFGPRLSPAEIPTSGPRYFRKTPGHLKKAQSDANGVAAEAMAQSEPLAEKTGQKLAISQLLGKAVADRTGVGFLDRKSTRLNSSHANISYAVLC